MYFESLQTEVKVLGKQKEPVGGEQQASGLVSENGNELHDESRKQTRLEGELPTMPCSTHFHCQMPRAPRWDMGPGRAGGRTNVLYWGFAVGLHRHLQPPQSFCSICLWMVVFLPTNELTWYLTEMLALKHVKEAMVLYGLHSPFVKEMLNNWATQHGVIPQDWKGLVSAVLKAGQWLQWLLGWRHKATKNLEQWNVVVGA